MLQNNETTFKLWRKYPLVRNLYNLQVRMLNQHHVKEREQLAAKVKPDPKFRVPKDKGYEIWSPGTFEEAPEIVEKTLQIINQHDMDNEATWGKAKKSYMHSKLLDMSTLTLKSPFLRLALREDVLKGVSEYLGAVPILTYASVWYSRNLESDLAGSQLYHYDPEDSTQLKLFVYCTDVDMPSGPFTILNALDSEKAVRETKYSKGNRLADTDVNRVVGANTAEPILGTVGTVLAADTSRCLHFGSRVEKDAKPRILAILQYLRPFAFENILRLPLNILLQRICLVSNNWRWVANRPNAR